MFIALLSFSSSLPPECVSLSNEPCMNSPNELNYYLFMISLDKYNRSCNAVDDLSTKICVPSKAKDIKCKVFNMITRIYEVEKMVNNGHISCKFK